MIKSNYPCIDVDDLATTIRESIKKHGTSVSDSLLSTDGSESRTNYSPLKLQPEFHPKSPGDRYHVNDLLRFHDRVFVESAHRAILDRYPSEFEYNHHLNNLRTGRINKIDVLATLRFSAEGKSKRVQIDGLRMRAAIRRLYHLPIVGYALRLGVALVRLPNIVRDQRQFEAYVLSQNQEIADFVNRVGAESRNELSSAAESLLRLEGLLLEIADHQVLQDARSNTQVDAIVQQLEKQREESNQLLQTFRDGMRREITALVTEPQGTLEELRAGLERVSQLLQVTQADLSIQASRIAATNPQPVVPGQQLDVPLDAIYAAVEDRFRGTREEIKERFRLYLPYIKQTLADNDTLVLDLGCGRGEWLELLRDEMINAEGVDSNRIHIGRCRKLGLSVVENDMLTYLRSLADGSAGAITGFHIIEHLSIADLISMLNEVMRVLRPGGIVLFETPNPENVAVGSNFFYFDPSHNHPLPSPLMELLMETRGFTDIKVLKIHPWDSGRVDGSGELAERFNGLFYGPMDYAILAWKVGA